MSLIARHCLIYGNNTLDFSVEETWSCPPMPTRAYQNNKSFLTQPKPDLAVCFRRKNLIPNRLWESLPEATRRLACYENINESARERVFHFFTIEAKKGNTATTGNVGKRQCLNNSSQALHNMFEFFREAGQQHEDSFFTKVRVFSVVASTEGLTIRIHRATRVPADVSGPGFVVEGSFGKPGYPLRFEFQEFSSIEKATDFNRAKVLEIFENILLGYGENELRLLISDAAEAIVANFQKNPRERAKRTANDDYYRYGQIFALKSRKQTPAGSIARSETNLSVDMLRSATATSTQSRISTSRPSSKLSGKQQSSATPTQSRASTPRQPSKLSGKRQRGQSGDSIAERYTRPRIQ